MRTTVTLSLVLIATGLGSACRIRSASTPLDVEQRAPDFTLRDHRGQEVTLAALTTNGPAVLVFNRGHR